MISYITEHGARIALAAVGLLCTMACPAEARQDLAALQPLAERFVRDQLQGTPGRVQISVGHPESRLRLSACDRPVAFAPPGARYWGNATVGVRCEGPQAWSLYLPVNVSVVGPVVVTARAIRKGETLGDSDVSVRDMDLTQLPSGGIDDTAEVVGRIARGPIAGGSVVRADTLRAQPVVLPGETVRVAYAGDGFEVYSAGRALTPGGIGEDVEVKAQSGRILRGMVRSKGWVVVR